MGRQEWHPLHEAGSRRAPPTPGVSRSAPLARAGAAALTLGLSGSSPADSRTGSRPPCWSSRSCRAPARSHTRWCPGSPRWTVRTGSPRGTCTCNCPGCCDRRLLRRCVRWGIRFHLQGSQNTPGVSTRDCQPAGPPLPLLGKAGQAEVAGVGRGRGERGRERGWGERAHCGNGRGLLAHGESTWKARSNTAGGER